MSALLSDRIDRAVIPCRPQAWVGCLACYNQGKLNGEWVDAADAADITPEYLHPGWGDEPAHDELWVFDTSEMPIRGECSPAEAARVGVGMSYVPDDEIPAFLAWVKNTHQDVSDDEDAYNAFVDAYVGEWDTFEDYAAEMVEESGLLSDVDETVAHYFNYDHYARDLAFDYTVLDADNGGVWIFQA